VLEKTGPYGQAACNQLQTAKQRRQTMKIKCTCGEVIPDQTDYLSYKAHIIGDKHYFDFLDTIDEAIERKEEDREKLCNNVRQAEANRSA
jgi:hypothetical protein